MKVYIAGQVTGIPYDDAFAAFCDAEVRLAYEGNEVVNPLRHCSYSWDWKKCMRVCLKMLTECDAIYMLKGWKKSKGAKLEHFVALKLGLHIMLEK